MFHQNKRQNSYQKSYAQHGDSPQALQWHNYSSAAVRYRELVNITPLDHRSILDAGCGMGDLLPYIYAQTRHFTYKGVDITPEFIEVATKRYAGHEFAVANPFDGSIKERYDVVISSGVMNFSIPDWQSERRAMIRALYDLTKEVLIFNMAGGLTPAHTDGKIAYANAEEVLAFCRSLTPKVSLKANYHPKDFTIAMFR